MSSQHLGDSDELAARLHSAVLHLLRRLAREDRATGESPARLSALSVLVFSGPRPVAGLEADGLVTRAADPGDRRTQRIAATARGREILVAGRARRVAALEALLVGVAEADRAALASAVTIIEQRLLGEP